MMPLPVAVAWGYTLLLTAVCMALAYHAGRRDGLESRWGWKDRWRW